MNQILGTSIAIILIAIAAISAYSGKVNVSVAPGDTAFGAQAGPDLQSPDGCFTFNGNGNCFYRQSLRPASSSLASFVTPGATTTIASMQCNQTGDAVALSWTIGWGATPYATTTQIARIDNVSANVPSTLTATGTEKTLALLGGTDGAIPPDSYINVRSGTSTLASISIYPAGSCSLILKKY